MSGNDRMRAIDNKGKGMDMINIIGMLLYIGVPIGVGAWLVRRWEGNGKADIDTTIKEDVDGMQWQQRIDM